MTQVCAQAVSGKSYCFAHCFLPLQNLTAVTSVQRTLQAWNMNCNDKRKTKAKKQTNRSLLIFLLD